METNFSAYLDDIYNFSLRMTGNRRKGEKLTRQIIEEAVNTEKYRAGGDTKMHLLRIAVNLCYKSFPSGPVIPLEIVEAEFEKLPKRVDKVEVSNLFKQLDDTDLMKLFLQIPPDIRFVIVLKEVLNLKYAAISELLDIPEGTLATRLSLARKYIYTELIKK